MNKFLDIYIIFQLNNTFVFIYGCSFHLCRG